MSGGAVAGGAAAAAVAAAQKAKLLRQEEEDMTKYTQDELNGWEFKIIRSNFRSFRDYEKVQNICREEAQAGWELVEKFDDQRLRFKRKIENRSKDQYLETDPYRTQIGMGEGKLVTIILGIVFVVGAFALFAVINMR